MALNVGAMKWLDDKKWADKFMPEIKKILGLHLISEANEDEDAMRNTDLIVLKLDVVRVAVRIRRHEYYLNPKYRTQFTMRHERPSGAQSEISKIMEGWGDYLFYGFSDSEEQSLQSWHLINLNKFRLWYNTQLFNSDKKQLPGKLKGNGDNSSTFLIFDINNMPLEIIKAHKYSGPKI